MEVRVCRPAVDVHPAAVSVVTGAAGDQWHRGARRPLRDVIAQRDIVKREVGALAENAAAPSIGVARLISRGAVVLRQAVADGQILEDDGDAAENLKHAVDLLRIDDRFADAGALDGNLAARLREIQIAFVARRSLDRWSW